MRKERGPINGMVGLNGVLDRGSKRTRYSGRKWENNKGLTPIQMASW
jgi:hypothetical protein